MHGSISDKICQHRSHSQTRGDFQSILACPSTICFHVHRCHIDECMHACSCRSGPARGPRGKRAKELERRLQRRVGWGVGGKEAHTVGKLHRLPAADDVRCHRECTARRSAGKSRPRVVTSRFRSSQKPAGGGWDEVFSALPAKCPAINRGEFRYLR